MFIIKKIIKKISTLLLILFLILGAGVCYLAIEYPIGYESLIVKYSNEYNLDPYLVASIINVESKYDTYAISSKDARGLMQISPQTGKWGSEVLEIGNYNEEILFEPETNIKIGTWYLSVLLKEFEGNIDLVLAAYNAGSGNVSKWLNNKEYSIDGNNLSSIPFKETEDYLKRVKDNYKIYSTVYKRYILNSTNENFFYIDLLHNIRRIIKTVISIR